MCVWGGRVGGDIIPRLNKVRTIDLSLCKSMECCQPVEGGDFQDIQSRRNSPLPAQGCEILMSNRSKDDLGRMNWANLKRTMPQSMISTPPPQERGKNRKLFNMNFA